MNHEVINQETFDIHIINPNIQQEIDDVVNTDKVLGNVYIDNGTENKDDDKVVYITRK